MATGSRNNLRRVVVSTLLSGAATLLPLTAQAEDQTQATTPAGGSVVDQAPQTDEGPVGDIVVTAQKREQRLLDVPLSMAAISGDALEERVISTPAELFQQLPNVNSQFASNTDGLPIFNIRGVTLLDFSETNEPSVATYIDEVYIGSSAVQNGQLFDLERIEVLRGPQGTLWGRNATGGVISWVTRRPTREFEGQLIASYGTWDDVKLQGVVSGPLAPEVRGRIAASFNKRGGTADNLFATGRREFGNIKENTVLRATVEIDLASNLLVTGNLHYGHYQAQSLPRGFFGALNAAGTRCAVADIFAGLCRGGPGAGNFRNPDPNPHEYYSELNDAPIDNKNYGGWLRGEWDLGGGWSLLSITSHDKVKRLQNIDVDGSGVPGQHVQFYIDHRQTTQELRASYESRAFNATLGGYFYADERLFTVTIPTLNIGSYAERDGQSYAVFGQGTYAVTPTLNLTAGARYTKDDIDYPIITFGQGGTPKFNALRQVYAVSRATRGEKVTWRLAGDWHFDPDHMVFASVSTGYKSAAVNSALPTSVAAVTVTQPETLTAYEAGIKGSFGAPSGFRYSVTAFHNDYKNIQVGATSSSATVIVTQLLNIDSAKISGVEAELSASPLRGLSLDLGLGYLDGKYSAPATLTIGGVQLNDKRPVMMPEFSVSGAVRYEHDLGGSAVFGSIDGRWQDRVFFGPDNLPTETQEGYAIFNARLGWKLSDNGLSVEGFVKNLTDKEYFAHIVDNGALGTINVTWGQPRTWGVQVTKRF